MRLTASIDNVSGVRDIPPPALMRRWLKSALRGRRARAELGVRIVDEAEGAALNARYRQRAGATNVLSFAADLPADVPVPLLGDLVLCAPVVIREAHEQGKAASAHWAHLLVHGALHLLGYDHVVAADAEIMEAEETAVLVAMGFSPPYNPPGAPQTPRP